MALNTAPVGLVESSPADLAQASWLEDGGAADAWLAFELEVANTTVTLRQEPKSSCIPDSTAAPPPTWPFGYVAFPRTMVFSTRSLIPMRHVNSLVDRNQQHLHRAADPGPG